MADQENADNKAKVLMFYKIMGALKGTLGVVMLPCGIIATLNIEEDEDIFGPPYFLGGYAVGVTALIPAMVCIYIILKAPDANTDAKKRPIVHAIYCHYILTTVLMGLSIMSILSALTGILVSYTEWRQINKIVTVIIAVGCVVGIVLAVYCMCMFSAIRRYFGISTILDVRHPTAQNNGASLNMAVFQTQYGQGMTNNGQMNQFGGQNQHQQQFGGSFSAYQPIAPS